MMSLLGKSVLLAGALSMLCSSCECVHPTIKSQATGNEKIPLDMERGSYVVQESLQISAAGEKVCFEEIVQESRISPEARIHLVNMKTRSDCVVSNVIPGAVALSLSKDGTYAIVETLDDLRIVELKNYRCVKAWKGHCGGHWMGTKAIIVTFGDNGIDASSVMSYDPHSGESREWPTVGMPLSVDSSGSHLLMWAERRGGGENDRGGNAALVVVDTNGKSIKEVEGAPRIASTPVVSDAFKWIAFQTAGSGSRSSEELGGGGIVLIEVSRWNVEVLDIPGIPIGVTDKGRVVVIQDTPGSGTSEIRLYGKDSYVCLSKGVLAGKLVDGRIYCVTKCGTASSVEALDMPE